MITKIGKWLLAIILIFFGIVLMLQNLDIISLEISNVVWDSWPVILVALGLISFAKFFHPRESGSWKFGSFLIIFGTLLWLGNFQYINFSFVDIWKLWPLILVYIGANLLFNRSSVTITFESSDDYDSKKRYRDFDDDDDFLREFDNVSEKLGAATEKINNKAKKGKGTYKYHLNSKNKFVTDVNFSKDNWEVQDLDLWTGVGDLYFDFSKAYIPNKETKIRLKGYVADIQMKMPDHVAYKIYARVNIGEVQMFDDSRSGFNNVIEYISDDYDTATRKLNIYMNYQVGDISVLSV
ncbi:cell wall-active antibiotics response protein LiaF [Bacillaceae bacterium W0354]